jgi:adenylate cyclase
VGIKELRDELKEEVQSINSTKFIHEITTTKLVPVVDDPAITYPNLVTRIQKSKLLTSAVLFVDMRGSTGMSMKHDADALAGVYASFVRAMSKCAHYYNGHVRNIIGDRVMVVFDRENCFRNAVNAAILMNSIVKYVLNKEISLVTIKAGIGIDFGPMLVTKTGVIKQGNENDANKALVWLGKPANVASKLTDSANKANGEPELKIIQHHYYSYDGHYADYTFPIDWFLNDLKMEAGRLMHQDTTITGFNKAYTAQATNPPILFTKYFYDLYVKEHPNQKDIGKGWWKEVSVSIPGYPNKIMGGDVIFKEIND